MPDWLAILKAYVDTLETIVGTEGGVALANKLTAARATLLDQITALRMAELDAANIPADIDLIKGYTDTLEGAIGAIEGATTLHNKLTAARAALLDQITALRMGELDAANLPADVDTLKAAIGAIEGATALHNKLTAARAAFLDAAISSRSTLTQAQILSDATPFAGANIAAIVAYVDTLETAIGAIEGATTLHNKLTAARAALLDQITAARLAELDAANIPADIDLIKGYTDTLEGAIGAIEGATTLHNKLTAARAALLDQITALRMGELDAANLPADVNILLARLTALRAGYLDNINQAGLLQVTAARAAYLDNLIGAVASGTFSLVNNILEQDALVIAAGTQRVDIDLDMNNLTQINTVREYVPVDGVNYRQISAKAFPTVFVTGTKCVIISFVQKNTAYKITLQASVLEGVARDIPWRRIVRDLS